MPPDAPGDLATRCADGDPSAWRELLATHRTLALRCFAKLVGHDRDVLLDLEQSLWERLARRDALRSVAGDTPQALRLLVAVTAQNLARDHLRRKGVRRVVVPVEDEQLEAMPGDGRDSPEDAARGAELRAHVLRAAEAAAGSPRNLVVFRLHYEQQCTAEEIAAHLGNLGAKGVESVLLRMTRKVRELLSELAKEEGLVARTRRKETQP